MQIELRAVAELNNNERTALNALTAAVNFLDTTATRRVQRLHWAAPQYSVLVFVSAGKLVSHVGIVVRTVTVGGTTVQIGGIGGVKTHPHYRGYGYASAGLRRAASALRNNHRVPFSLLVCREHLLPFYERLGWLTFEGRVLFEQPTGQTAFSIRRPMTLSGLSTAPHDGTIDIEGLPW